jgi:hypothetical protein
VAKTEDVFRVAGRPQVVEQERAELFDHNRPAASGAKSRIE